MEFKTIEVTTLEELMVSTRGNISHAALKLDMNRNTLRQHLKAPENMIIVEVNGKLKPFICDRRTGQHKREKK